MVDAIGAAELRFGGADAFVALRACRVVEFERARFQARVRFRARDLQRRGRGRDRRERGATVSLRFTSHVKILHQTVGKMALIGRSITARRRRRRRFGLNRESEYLGDNRMHRRIADAQPLARRRRPR